MPVPTSEWSGVTDEGTMIWLKDVESLKKEWKDGTVAGYGGLEASIKGKQS